MPEPLISLKKVKKRYGHTDALKGVTFELNEGDFFCVFGPNGAGKSTLLKILSTQTRPSSGEIIYDGTPLNKLKDDFRAHFGVISHEPFLYENLTAEENLYFYARLYGVKDVDNVVSELFKRVELSKRRHDKVRGYSRGMLQRLSIARALLHNPNIIFLDEPYTGLDQHASMVLTNILKEQFSMKKTIIMVTHNLPRGYELATRIGIINQGKFALLEDKKNVPEQDFEDIYIDVVG